MDRIRWPKWLKLERYRQAGITLNVVMLVEACHTIELASILADKKLARVFLPHLLDWES